ncbi:MAG: hypothetical protein HY587_08215 [Candidatus Omnitrophica bacterium]|nr:hypothetical protein [Candidatus Omnitrophota bacterium]
MRLKNLSILSFPPRRPRGAVGPSARPALDQTARKRESKTLGPRFRGGDAIFLTWRQMIAAILLFSFTLTQVFPAEASNYFQASSGLNSPYLAMLDHLAIPEEMGRVEETFRGNSGELVLYIQDAHANYGAQKAIASLIDYFLKNHKVALVGLEGADGGIDPGLLRAFPITEVKQEVMERSLRSGEISGAEYLAVAGEKDFDLVGIDRRKVYRENLAQFFEVLDAAGSSLEAIRSIRTAMKNLQSTVYSKAHRGLSDLIARHKDGRADIGILVKGLREYAKQSGEDLSPYPRLSRWPERLDDNADAKALIADLDILRFYREIERLSFAIKFRLAGTELEMKLIALEEYLNLLESGCRVELTRTEFSRLTELHQLFGGELIQNLLTQSSRELKLPIPSLGSESSEMGVLFEKLGKFYWTAGKRDEIFARRIRKEMHVRNESVSVLVSGGFHKEGVTRMLRQKGVSYAVILPRISENDSEGDYLRLMDKNRSLANLPEANTIALPSRLGTPEFRQQFLADSLERMFQLASERQSVLTPYGVDDPSLLPLLVEQSLARRGIRLFSDLGVAASPENLLTAARRWDNRRAATGAADLLDAVRSTATRLPKFFGEDLENLSPPHRSAKWRGNDSGAYEATPVGFGHLAVSETEVIFVTAFLASFVVIRFVVPYVMKWIKKHQEVKFDRNLAALFFGIDRTKPRPPVVSMEEVRQEIYRQFPHLLQVSFLRNPILWVKQSSLLLELAAGLMELDKVYKTDFFVKAEKAISVAQKVMRVEQLLGLRDESRRFEVSTTQVRDSPELRETVIPYRYLEPSAFDPQSLGAAMITIEDKAKAIRSGGRLPVVRIIGKAASGVTALVERIEYSGSFAGISSEDIAVVDDKLLWSAGLPRDKADLSKMPGLLIIDNSWDIDEISVGGQAVHFEPIDVYVEASEEARWARQMRRAKGEPMQALELVMNVHMQAADDIRERYFGDSVKLQADIVAYSDELFEKIASGKISNTPIVPVAGFGVKERIDLLGSSAKGKPGSKAVPAEPVKKELTAEEAYSKPPTWMKVSENGFGSETFSVSATVNNEKQTWTIREIQLRENVAEASFEVDWALPEYGRTRYTLAFNVQKGTFSRKPGISEHEPNLFEFYALRGALEQIAKTSDRAQIIEPFQKALDKYARKAGIAGFGSRAKFSKLPPKTSNKKEWRAWHLEKAAFDAHEARKTKEEKKKVEAVKAKIRKEIQKTMPGLKLKDWLLTLVTLGIYGIHKVIQNSSELNRLVNRRYEELKARAAENVKAGDDWPQRAVEKPNAQAPNAELRGKRRTYLGAKAKHVAMLLKLMKDGVLESRPGAPKKIEDLNERWKWMYEHSFFLRWHSEAERKSIMDSVGLAPSDLLLTIQRKGGEVFFESLKTVGGKGTQSQPIALGGAEQKGQVEGLETKFYLILPRTAEVSNFRMLFNLFPELEKLVRKAEQLFPGSHPTEEFKKTREIPLSQAGFGSDSIPKGEALRRLGRLNFNEERESILFRAFSEVLQKVLKDVWENPISPGTFFGDVSIAIEQLTSPPHSFSAPDIQYVWSRVSDIVDRMVKPDGNKYLEFASRVRNLVEVRIKRDAAEALRAAEEARKAEEARREKEKPALIRRDSPARGAPRKRPAARSAAYESELAELRQLLDHSNRKLVPLRIIGFVIRESDGRVSGLEVWYKTSVVGFIPAGHFPNGPEEFLKQKKLDIEGFVMEIKGDTGRGHVIFGLPRAKEAEVLEELHRDEWESYRGGEEQKKIYEVRIVRVIADTRYSTTSVQVHGYEVSYKGVLGFVPVVMGPGGYQDRFTNDLPSLRKELVEKVFPAIFLSIEHRRGRERPAFAIDRAEIQKAVKEIRDTPVLKRKPVAVKVTGFAEIYDAIAGLEVKWGSVTGRILFSEIPERFYQNGISNLIGTTVNAHLMRADFSRGRPRVSFSLFDRENLYDLSDDLSIRARSSLYEVELLHRLEDAKQARTQVRVLVTGRAKSGNGFHVLYGGHVSGILSRRSLDAAGMTDSQFYSDSILGTEYEVYVLETTGGHMGDLVIFSLEPPRARYEDSRNAPGSSYTTSDQPGRAESKPKKPRRGGLQSDHFYDSGFGAAEAGFGGSAQRQEVIEAVREVVERSARETGQPLSEFGTVVFGSESDFARFEKAVVKYSPAVRAQGFGVIQNIVAGWEVAEEDKSSIWLRMSELFSGRGQRIYVGTNDQKVFAGIRSGAEAALLGQKTEYLLRKVEDQFVLERMSQNGDRFMDVVLEALYLRQLAENLTAAAA